MLARFTRDSFFLSFFLSYLEYTRRRRIVYSFFDSFPWAVSCESFHHRHVLQLRDWKSKLKFAASCKYLTTLDRSVREDCFQRGRNGRDEKRTEPLIVETAELNVNNGPYVSVYSVGSRKTARTASNLLARRKRRWI